MNTPQLRTIHIDSIVCDRRWSLHRDLPDALSDGFIASIERFGILHPPILRPLSPDTFELLCGSNRLRGAIDILQYSSVDCLVLPHAVPVADILLLSLEDQRNSSPLSPIESGRFYRLCRDNLDDAQSLEIEREAALGNRRQLDQFARLLTLERQLRMAVHQGDLSVQVGLELLTLSGTDRELLFELFTKLRLNRNKQRRLLEMGRTIMMIEDFSSFAELLAQLCPHLVAERGVTNPPQAAQQLLRDLQLRSSPMSSRAEQEFTAQRVAFNLPQQCALNHAKSFEQDHVTLEIRFKDIEEFRLKWKRLKETLSKS